MHDRVECSYKIKVKVWVLGYIAAYMSRLEQQRFTISEVAADWHELMTPWRIMRPSVARDGEQVDPRCSTHHRLHQRTMPNDDGNISLQKSLP